MQLLDVLDSSLLGPVTMDVTITGFRESDDGTIIIDFKLEISQTFLASEDLVAIAVKDSIRWVRAKRMYIIIVINC